METIYLGVWRNKRNVCARSWKIPVEFPSNWIMMLKPIPYQNIELEASNAQCQTGRIWLQHINTVGEVELAIEHNGVEKSIKFEVIGTIAPLIPSLQSLIDIGLIRRVNYVFRISDSIIDFLRFFKLLVV